MEIVYLCSAFDKARMNITTENKALVELLLYGKSTDKRYRKLPQRTIDGFLKAYTIIAEVERIEDLYRYNGLHYEKLVGKLKGYESVRCDKRYRLIFKSNAQQQIQITDVVLIEITDHYGNL